MISFKGNIKEIVHTFENEAIITIISNANNLSWEELKTLQDSKNGVKIDISRWREKRSLDSNAYAWVLMDKIADKTNTTKEMSRFLDEVVSEAKELDIPTETPEQIAEMKSLWGSYEK